MMDGVIAISFREEGVHWSFYNLLNVAGKCERNIFSYDGERCKIVNTFFFTRCDTCFFEIYFGQIYFIVIGFDRTISFDEVPTRIVYPSFDRFHVFSKSS